MHYGLDTWKSYLLPTLTCKAVNYLVPIPAETYSRINANVLNQSIKKNLGKCILNSRLKLIGLVLLVLLRKSSRGFLIKTDHLGGKESKDIKYKE